MSLVLLEQHTAAGSPSLDFTSFISGLYDDYLIELVGIVPANAGAALWVRAGTGAGPAWDAVGPYSWAQWRYLWNGSGAAGSTSDTKMIAHLGISTAAGWSANGSLRLVNPAGALFKELFGRVAAFDSAAASYLGTEVVGAYLSATAMTGLQFLMSAGNIAAGTGRIYGIG